MLRNAVKKLLQKRGMKFSLGRCGGAFQVDALSGWDLYDEEQPSDSKVLLMDQDQFNEMATESRRSDVCHSLNSLGNGKTRGDCFFRHFFDTWFYNMLI